MNETPVSTENSVSTETHETHSAPALPPIRAWVVPAADVLEKDGDLRLRVDIPGATREAVQLDVADGVLTLTARRADVTGRGYRRRFRLPEEVDAAAVSATLTHGVLTIDLPRTAQARPRRIEIR